MTGDEFKKLRQKLGSLRDVAEAWGITKSTLQREEQKEEVRRLYAAAIRWEVQNPETTV
jgi:hypothetical protein